MIADIVTGNTGTADVAFLVAVILACVAAVLAWRPPPSTESRLAGPALAAAVAAFALGLLLL